ncbi:MAG: putative baseplate assembly protein, partial [Phototrophicaceae bacterium]
INHIEACWLRAELRLPLAPQKISNEDIMPLTERILELQNFEPFHAKRRFPLLIHLKTADDEAETITLDVKLAKQGQATDKLILAWEYWNGDAWAEIGRTGKGIPEDAPDTRIDDGTLAFTQDGTISFQVPDDWAQVNDGGWIRITVKAGSYGRKDQAAYPEIETLTGHYVWMLRDLPYIERVSISAETSQTGLIPPRAYFNSQPLDLSADAFPFGIEPSFNSTFFITCDEAFSKPNAEITLQIGITNPVNAETSDPLPPVLPSANLQLSWEMWDGTTWQQIGLSTPQNDSAGTSTYHFSDGTFCFLQSGRVRFVLPWGVSTTELSNGDNGYWLRVRIVQGNYGLPQQYRQTGGTYQLIEASFRPPAINYFTIDYRYLPEVPADTCLAYNDFHYSDVTHISAAESSVFQPFHRSTDTSPALYLRVESTSPDDILPFQNAPVTFFLDIDNQYNRAELDRIAATITSHNPAQVVWEYRSPAGWQALQSIDHTHMLTERGTVSFIGANDFMPTSEFDQTGYWLRIRWVQGSYKVLPRLRHLLINTVWGLQGQRFSNQILGSSTGEPHQQFTIQADDPILAEQQLMVQQNRSWSTWQQVTDFYSSQSDDQHYTLNRSTGLVRFGNGIFGAVPAAGANNIRITYRTGGTRKGNVDEKRIDQLKTTIPRVAGVLNHVPAQGGDEQEALSRTKKRGPTLLRHHNRAVTADDYVDLAYEIAAIKRAIAITPGHGAATGQVGLVIVPDSHAPQPMPSLGLIEQVREKLLAVAPPTIDLWVTGPDWICVSITVEFVPQSFDLAVATKYEINRRLQTFLHPLLGFNGQGWTFGRVPQQSDIYALLEPMMGVDHIRFLDIDLTWDDKPRPNRFLVYSGYHDIRISGERD